MSQAHLSQSAPPLRDWTQLKPPKRDSTVPGALKTHVNTQAIAQTNEAVVEISFGITLAVFNLFPKEKFLGEKRFLRPGVFFLCQAVLKIFKTKVSGKFLSNSFRLLQRRYSPDALVHPHPAKHKS